MSYRNKTYIIFDGDEDMWAYRYMKGWKALSSIPFNFHDAHDVGFSLTEYASELTVKARLRQRFASAKQVVVLVGDKTRNLYRYVRWELEVALDLNLPIIAVNLNGLRVCDNELCPPIIRDKYVVHIPYKRAVIKYALDQFPGQHADRTTDRGPLYYPESIYAELGLQSDPPLSRAASPASLYGSSWLKRNLLSDFVSSPSADPFAGLLGLSTPPPKRGSTSGLLSDLLKKKY